MPADYLPVMFSMDHPHPELEQWIADRFEKLNGKRVHIVRRGDLPKEAQNVRSIYTRPWLWDVLPDDVQNVLVFDYDVVPLRPIPELPDVPFAAAPDSQRYVEERSVEFPTIATSGLYFNAGLFMAHRSTRLIFDQLKAFILDRDIEHPTMYAFDQTAFNLLVQSNIEMTWLPRDYNVIALDSTPEMSSNAVAFHLCGLTMDARWVVMNLLRSTLGMSELP